MVYLGIPIIVLNKRVADVIDSVYIRTKPDIQAPYYSFSNDEKDITPFLIALHDIMKHGLNNYDMRILARTDKKYVINGESDYWYYVGIYFMDPGPRWEGDGEPPENIFLDQKALGHKTEGWIFGQYLDIQELWY